MSRSPRQVDSRFILILVDVVAGPGVTDAGDDGGFEEHEATTTTSADG